MTPRQCSLNFRSLLAEFNSQKVACAEVEARGLRCDERDLSEYANPSHPRTAPLHIVAALEEACGKPMVSRAMAAAVMGCSQDTVSLAIVASNAAQAAAKAMGHVIAADDDGVITPAEEAQCVSTIRRTISVLDELAQRVSAKAGAGS